jgi:hypothetical protein
VFRHDFRLEESGYDCNHVGAWRRVTESPPNDTGDKYAVSGEFIG